MKKIFYLLLIAVLASCSSYDDSALWDKVNGLADRVTKLETLCQQMNTNIVSLQKLVTALQKNESIKQITELPDGSGYLITFTSDKSIIIYNGTNGKDGTNGVDGTDGKDGVDGVTPAIGVKKDVDGIYYWTVDGEWLLADGKKVKAEGTDGNNGAPGVNGADGVDGTNGITPQFKIENDYWYVSYDNQQTWKQLGRATGNDATSIQITQDDENVYFELEDGTIITVPKEQPIRDTDFIHFDDIDAKIFCTRLSWDTNNDGELSYAEAAAVESMGGSSSGISMFHELQYFTRLKSLTTQFSNLVSIVLPDSITTIGDRVFYQCTSLRRIDLPKNLTKIGESAFDGCTKIRSVVLPETLDSIGDKAFYYCDSLKNVVIPKNIKSIGTRAFQGCYLQDVVFPDGDYKIGERAFCNVKSAILPNAKENRWRSVFNSTYLQKVEFVEGVTTIEEGMFYDYRQLSEVILPSTIKQIRDRAFYSVKTPLIVVCKAVSPPTIRAYITTSYTYSPFPKGNVILYVPSHSIDAYFNSNWGDYAREIKSLEEYEQLKNEE